MNLEGTILLVNKCTIMRVIHRLIWGEFPLRIEIIHSMWNKIFGFVFSRENANNNLIVSSI